MVPKLRHGSWHYLTLKAGVKPKDSTIRKSRLLYLYSPDAVDKLRQVLPQK